MRSFMLIALPALLAAQDVRTVAQPPGAAVPRRIDLASPRVEVPLTKVGPFYYMEVRLNGQPFRFTLETGASFIAIGNRAARALGLPADTTRPVGGMVMMRPGMPMVTARLDSIGVGGATFRDVEVRVTSGFDAMEFDGIASPRLFHDLLWTMDLGRSRLILERGELPPPNGRDVLAIVGADAGGRVDVPMDLGGRRVSAVLDTRYSDWIMTNDTLLPALRLASPVRRIGMARGPSLGEFEMRGARLADTVQVGSYVLPRTPLMFRNRGGTIVGVSFLEQFVTTVDQRNGRIRLSRADTMVVASQQAWENPALAAPAASGGDGPARTFGFRMAARPDGRLFVVMVDSASAAARQGIRENDEVVEFDGVPANRMSPQIFRAALARDTPVRITIVRDGTKTVFEVVARSSRTAGSGGAAYPMR